MIMFGFSDDGRKDGRSVKSSGKVAISKHPRRPPPPSVGCTFLHSPAVTPPQARASQISSHLIHPCLGHGENRTIAFRCKLGGAVGFQKDVTSGLSGGIDVGAVKLTACRKMTHVRVLCVCQ